MSENLFINWLIRVVNLWILIVFRNEKKAATCKFSCGWDGRKTWLTMERPVLSVAEMGERVELIMIEK